MKSLKAIRQLVRDTLHRFVGRPNSPVVEIDGMTYSRDYGLELRLKHPVVIELAAHLAKFFTEQGGKNYVEFSTWHKDLGELVFTVQRRNGETPAMQAARWKRKCEELMANPRADRAAHLVRGTVEPFVGGPNLVK